MTLRCTICRDKDRVHPTIENLVLIEAIIKITVEIATRIVTAMATMVVLERLHQGISQATTVHSLLDPRQTNDERQKK
jgi:hypothetical protein